MNHQDDGYDYTAILIAEMNGVRNLKLDSFSPPPQRVKVISHGALDRTHDTSNASIGSRRIYSRNVVMCIFWLKRHKFSDDAISKKSGMPLREVEKILSGSTQMQRQIARMIAASSDLSIPAVYIVMNNLRSEPQPNKIIKDKKK